MALPEAGEDGAPAVGRLAPWDSTLATDWVTVGSIPAEMAGNQVTALDALGDTLFVLQDNQWIAVRGNERWGPYGSRAVGAPDYIAAGLGIVRIRGGVLILDRSRQTASLWSLDGTRGAELSLRSTDASFGSPVSVAPDGPAAALIGVLALDDRGTQWSVFRLADASFGRLDTLIQDPFVRRPGAAWEVPFLAARPDGSRGILAAESWRLRVLGADGSVRVDTVRHDVPRWVGDRARRQRLLELSSQAPSLMREAFAPREYPPTGRGLSAAGNSHWIALSADEQEHFHAELLDAEGQPIARFWREPETATVFAVRGALYRVRALDDRTVIDRQEIRLP